MIRSQIVSGCPIPFLSTISNRFLKVGTLFIVSKKMFSAIVLKSSWWFELTLFELIKNTNNKQKPDHE